MGFNPGNALSAVPDVHTRNVLKSLGLEFDKLSKTVSTIVRNNQNVVNYALDTVNVSAGSGLTGGGDLTADISLAVGAGFGVTVAADSVAVDQGMVPTWTGIHTFSAQDVHNAGVSLGTSGALVSAVADGASAIAFDLADATTRTQGYARQLRRGSTILESVSWDGRYSFGYGSGVAPIAGHVLGFFAQDSDSPAGAPVYIGIYASVKHSDTAETVPRLVGLIGNTYVTTATGLSAVVVNGVTGSASCDVDSSFTNKVLVCFSGALTKTSSVSLQPITKDISFGKSASPQGGWDHVSVYWAPNFSFSHTTGYPTTYKPAIVSAIRTTIQDWGGSVTNGTPLGEYWSVYGEHINGSSASYPTVTGFMRCVYPRRTANSAGTTRAMHVWFEPWPMSAAGAGAAGAVRPNAAEGDVYFDDNTNFAGGLWEFNGCAGGANAWNYLLNSPGIDALGGGAAATMGTIGGTGPAAAAQATWIQVNCADNVVRWVPAWV